MGASGSGAPRKGDYRLPEAAEETDAKGGQTASAAWAGTAQRGERGTDGRAGYQGEREQALTFEYKQEATTLMRAKPRSVWLACPDTLCANGRDGRVLDARKAL